MNELTKVESISLFDLVLKGGWIMIPIFLMSFLLIYVFIERMISMAPSKIFISKKKLKDIAESVRKAKPNEIYHYLPDKNIEAPFMKIADVLEKNFNSSTTEDLQAALTLTAEKEIKKLYSKIEYISFIGNISTLLGFLGTVTGMISAFMAIANSDGIVSPKIMANGIYEALVTTVSGLIIGVMAACFHNIIRSKLDNFTESIEELLNTIILNFKKDQ